MRMTTEELHETLRRNKAISIEGEFGNKRIGSCPRHEEQQDAVPGKIDHKARKAEVDGGVHPQYVFAVDLRVSDKRKRDADGALTTLLDCVVIAARRLSEMDKEDSGKCGGCIQG